MQVKCSLFNHWRLCFTLLSCSGRRVRRNVVRRNKSIMNYRSIVLILFLSLLSSRKFIAQDSTTTIETYKNTVNDWAIGIQLGSSYPFLLSTSKKLISNEIGFSFGMEISYKTIFSKFIFCSMDSKVKNTFYLTDEWIKNLPLDLVQYQFLLGYRINLYEQFYLKPMLSIMDLNYSTDERVREFTNIKRDTDLGYYGLSVGVSYDYLSTSQIISRTDVEITLSLYEPFNSKKKKVFPDKVLNVSFGILFYR
jgi:hypothetical protein